MSLSFKYLVKTIGRNARVIRGLPLFLLPLMMFCSLPAYAEYSFQLVIPPGSENSQAFGINNAGKIVGLSFDGMGGGYSFMYDMKSGEYTEISNQFSSLEINNAGVMVGGVDNYCAIRDKKGGVTTFSPQPLNENSYCRARAVNSNGKVSGFVRDEFAVFTGFIHDPQKGTFEEFLPSSQTITQGINAQGQNVGSVRLDADEIYPGSPEGRYGYLREKNGSVKYFAISQSVPGQSRARGISENGLVTGFYADPELFEFKGYVTTLSKGTGFEEITLTDDEIVFQSPCDPDLPPPDPGYVVATDLFTAQVRNDGVVIGSCRDYHFDVMTGDLIEFNTYGFIATPVK